MEIRTRPQTTIHDRGGNACAGRRCSSCWWLGVLFFAVAAAVAAASAVAKEAGRTRFDIGACNRRRRCFGRFFYLFVSYGIIVIYFILIILSVWHGFANVAPTACSGPVPTTTPSGHPQATAITTLELPRAPPTRHPTPSAFGSRPSDQSFGRPRGGDHGIGGNRT